MIKFDNLYIKNTSSVVGPLEKEGPLKEYFDKSYENYYMDKDYELSEIKLQEDAINILLKKEKKETSDIDLFVSGDLSNQLTASCYAQKKTNIPFLGLFSACATSIENIIVAGAFLDGKKINNAITTVSSHNLAAEKQFRNPVEYGAPKRIAQTFTATGAVSVLLTNNKTNIKINSATIGKVTDMNQKDVNNMGAVMACAAADTIYKHLKESNKSVNDYDLILTGDLGIFGSSILKEYMKEEYKIDLDYNYKDCGTMLYDMSKQKEITAGASGPTSLALVCFTYIYEMLKKNKLKKVLFVATGALFSPALAYQKQNLLSIAHAVEVERI